MHLVTTCLIFDGPGFDFRCEKHIFLVSKMCTSSLGPTLHHIQRVKLKIKQSRYRPGLAQRVPGS